ncbi:CYTH and CHAD domain-containing protein [Nocardioides anomalus]|uniref:CYTH and CHAD domain-containing protein n=1 Tax=Nocardioides anomalus TaxID=2712223 RepID=A0A6G6WDG2_9ACTN|nr:CYTH and CHAD domain-containing protein [Nocardioides anomalus]QIG43282.1 CYTH and CHAD domain-containing protein [Nocardioides anomalus]
MTRTQLEVERVFSPGPDVPVPDLTRAGPVVGVDPVGEVELDATYHDTPGLTLIRAGVTLRRREGGPDEGWHLKLPVGAPDARRELHVPLREAPDPVPDELLDLVDGWTRGIAVAPVARIRTHRTTYHLVGPEGEVLAELADDRVTGRAAQLDAQDVTWREWEVELVDGDRELLDVVEAVLAAHDVHRSAVTRKVAVVLGLPTGAHDVAPALTRKGPARLLLRHWLETQVHEIARLDPVVRRGGAGGVHGVRKACRRLRAALATYRALADRERTEPVREELRWLARSLGQLRDDEVVRDRIARQLAREELFGEPALRLLEEYAAGRAAEGRVDVAEVLTSTRYHALRTALDDLVARPPWTGAADGRARDVLPARLAREWRRTRRRRRDGADVHEVRRAVKRLRYALELVEPAWDDRARQPRRAARGVTRVLGDHQDSVVARQWLHALAAEAARTGVPSFALGRQHALEEQREREALAEAGAAWAVLARAVSRWAR